jgi:hypothetical protein
MKTSPLSTTLRTSLWGQYLSSRWLVMDIWKMFKFLARRGCQDMTIIVAGDFNVNMRDNCNAKPVGFMTDSLEHDCLWDLCQETARSDSSIDMVFG